MLIAQRRRGDEFWPVLVSGAVAGSGLAKTVFWGWLALRVVWALEAMARQ